MGRFFAKGQQESHPLTHDDFVRLGAGPLLAVLLAGLLAEVAPHDEARAGLDYALALLATLGAAGAIAGFTYRLGLNPDPLPGPGATPGGSPAGVLVPGTVEGGERWPLLVALLLGPFVVLLAGLGGWV